MSESANENGTPLRSMLAKAKEDDVGSPAGAAGMTSGKIVIEKPVEPRNIRIKRLVYQLTSAIILSAIISLATYFIALKLGVYALGTLGSQLQDEIALVITSKIESRMFPLAIFLRQVLHFVEENSLDIENFDDIKRIIPVAHGFLKNYFDDSRCCWGFFVNVPFPDDVKNATDEMGKKVLKCHAQEQQTNCTVPNYYGSNNSKWVGVLHYSNTYANQSGFYNQVLPEIPEGSSTNKLYFKSYEGKAKMEAGNPENHVGFVPFAYGDGYWYHDIVQYELKHGDIHFCKVFPFDLYPPVVLKTHGYSPLYKNGKRIGGMVVGFKLHWMSKFLAELNIKPGMMTMLVERVSGHLVATSNEKIPLLTANNKAVVATKCEDEAFATMARETLAIFGNDWNNARPYKSNDISQNRDWSSILSQSADDFTIVFEYRSMGVDWIGISRIPYDSLMFTVTDHQIALGLISILIALAIKTVGSILQALGEWKLFGREKSTFEIDPEAIVLPG
eukprot:PhF_6_TR27873/c3_g1_i3/m.40775